MAFFVAGFSSDDGSIFDTQLPPSDETGGGDNVPEVVTIVFNVADSSNDVPFAATAQHDESFEFPVERLKPGTEEEEAATETFNEAFFGASYMDATAFDGIALFRDLNSIASSGAQKITNLSVGDVVEFEDNYDKNGLIKITDIQSGFGNADFIELDVKIQP